MDPLPEVPPPSHADVEPLRELARPHGSRLVWGEGDPDAPVRIVLDNPGAREARTGEPWVCPTRTTLREATRGAGIPDEALYVTWLLKWRPRRAYDKPAARAACAPHLLEDLARPGARVVVALGNVAARAVTGDAAAEVRDLRTRPLTHAGVPLVVGYHPLAAHRRPNLRRLLDADLARAAALLPA